VFPLGNGEDARHGHPLIGQAHELGLLTTPYVFSPEDAQAMAGAGADVLVAHMGLTTGGTIGAETRKTLGESVQQACADAVRVLAGDAPLHAASVRDKAIYEGKLPAAAG